MDAGGFVHSDTGCAQNNPGRPAPARGRPGSAGCRQAAEVDRRADAGDGAGGYHQWPGVSGFIHSDTGHAQNNPGRSAPACGQARARRRTGCCTGCANFIRRTGSHLKAGRNCCRTGGDCARANNARAPESSISDNERTTANGGRDSCAPAGTRTHTRTDEYSANHSGRHDFPSSFSPCDRRKAGRSTHPHRTGGWQINSGHHPRRQ